MNTQKRFALGNSVFTLALALVVLSAASPAQATNTPAQPLANQQQDSKPFFMNFFKKNTNSNAQAGSAGGVFNPVKPKGNTNKTAQSAAAIDPTLNMSAQARYDMSKQVREQTKSDIRAKAAAKDAQTKARRTQEAQARQARWAAAQKQQAAQAGVPVQQVQGAPGTVAAPAVQQPARMVYEDPAKKDNKPAPIFGITR